MARKSERRVHSHARTVQPHDTSDAIGFCRSANEGGIEKQQQILREYADLHSLTIHSFVTQLFDSDLNDASFKSLGCARPADANPCLLLIVDWSCLSRRGYFVQHNISLHLQEIGFKVRPTGTAHRFPGSSTAKH